jgi:hypothetical protein
MVSGLASGWSVLRARNSGGNQANNTQQCGVVSRISNWICLRTFLKLVYSAEIAHSRDNFHVLPSIYLVNITITLTFATVLADWIEAFWICECTRISSARRLRETCSRREGTSCRLWRISQRCSCTCARCASSGCTDTPEMFLKFIYFWEFKIQFLLIFMLCENQLLINYT